MQICHQQVTDGLVAEDTTLSRSPLQRLTQQHKELSDRGKISDTTQSVPDEHVPYPPTGVTCNTTSKQRRQVILLLLQQLHIKEIGTGVYFDLMLDTIESVVKNELHE